MALAGVWENWHSPAGEWVRSFAIITTTPNELCAELHNRMPVVLKPDAWPAWLGEEPADEAQLRALLAPYPSDDMILLAGEHSRRQRQEQRSAAHRADYFPIAMPRSTNVKRRCGLRRRVIPCVRCRIRSAQTKCRNRKSHKRWSCST
jgi:hypothetical protein